MSILILAEHDGKTLSPPVRHAVTAATQIGGEVHILIAGQGAKSVAEQAAAIAGVSKIRLADAAHYANNLAEEVAPLLVSLAADYSHFLAAATSFGKNLMPRIAALLDVGQLSDVMEIQAPNRVKRPIYAGNIIATVETTDSKIVMTIRKTAFDAAPTGGNATIEPVAATAPSGQSRFVRLEVTPSTRPELTNAAIVVSGGRGLGSKEQFALIEQLADTLGAAVGASRAAVDAGYAPNDWQIGQTGKVVAPSLYIAVGISGAIQHLAGMKDSKVIVAINKDENAPIFEVADYGLVADLFQAVPELMQALPKR